MGVGFAAIGLDNPKSGENVGGVMRAVGIYGAQLIVIGGRRFKTIRHFPTDTMKAWRQVPVLQCDDVFENHPVGPIPVAVDLVPDATPLPEYVHPKNAFYIFGAEDATLGARILSKCRDRVFIPTARCMNLAATVNVVLYDRCVKLKSWPSRTGRSAA